jgi:hypothetical protein
MEVRIARIDECPRPSKVVGFSITHEPTGKSLYLDAFVPLTDCEHATEHEIAKKGWGQVKPAATQWIEDLDKKRNSIIGSVLDIN